MLGLALLFGDCSGFLLLERIGGVGRCCRCPPAQARRRRATAFPASRVPGLLHHACEDLGVLQQLTARRVIPRGAGLGEPLDLASSSSAPLFGSARVCSGVGPGENGEDRGGTGRQSRGGGERGRDGSSVSDLAYKLCSS